ncbi:MAG: HlyD family secretion protein [bacterium]
MPEISSADKTNSAPAGILIPWYRQRNAVLGFRAILAATVIGLLYWYVEIHPYVYCDDAVVAATLARVAPQGAGGLVSKVDVAEGDRVVQGQTLVELDPAKAQAELENASAVALLASKELKRGEELAAENGVSPRQLDKVRAEAVEADAQRRLAQIALDHCTLKSPFAGVVVEKATDVGNHIETGQTAVTVADMDHAWVVANVEETDAEDLKPGQPVSISVDEGGSLTGKVLDVDQATLSTFAMIPTESSSGNFIKLVQRIPVKIALDPHSGRILRVGQSVEVHIKVR